MRKIKKRGFAALILVVLVSAALMSAVLQNSDDVSVMFDEANHKQYRLSAVESAMKCLDTSFLEITHDYFFEVSASSGISYVKDRCRIASVVGTSGFLAGSGYETITVSGNSNSVEAVIIAQILLSDRKITLLSQKTFLE